MAKKNKVTTWVSRDALRAHRLTVSQGRRRTYLRGYIKAWCHTPR